jgi:exodeoxyribonuclease V beta subunit
MAEAMLHAHYPLQALLYDVALHRFLRWRVAGYDPERHLGSVLYLFLRGMCGPGVVAEDGTVPGVFAWRPPAALVVAISDVLAKGPS